MPNTSLETIQVNTQKYLSIPHTERIKDSLDIELSSHSYLPRIEDVTSDWVAHVAAPAFRLYRAKRGGAPIESFCSIGTGSGLDVLSAIEALSSTRVGLTDVHDEVVSTAAQNVARNIRARHAVKIESGFGDLLAPLRPYHARYDVIYENLPNVPLDNDSEVAIDRKSSAYLAQRKEPIPELIRQKMLDLHYLALQQAKEFLTPGGVVLSTLGARVPLSVFIALGELAGYSSSLLTYTWKVQADPEEVIRDHAHKQREGFGPFHFYPAAILEQTFSHQAYSGDRAQEIETSLLPHQLDAEQAYAALQKGERIGHTVAVLESTPR